jgi:hypothetical protein
MIFLEVTQVWPLPLPLTYGDICTGPAKPWNMAASCGKVPPDLIEFELRSVYKKRCIDIVDLQAASLGPVLYENIRVRVCPGIAAELGHKRMAAGKWNKGEHYESR